MKRTETYFFLSDIKDLIYRKKRKIFITSCLFFLGIFFLISFKNIIYQTEAVYQEAAITKRPGNIEELIFNSRSTYETKAMSFFKTRKIGKNLVERLGLQIKNVEDISFVKDKYKKIKNNLFRAMNLPIEEIYELEFCNVLYRNDSPLDFFIVFKNDFEFEVLNEKRSFITFGRINQEIDIDDLKFTLTKVPKELFKKKTYHLKVLPFDIVVDEIISNISIFPDKSNANILKLKFKYYNKIKAPQILNNMMKLHEEHLKYENSSIIKKQLNYLETRQNELNGKLEKTLVNYEKYLKKNIQKKGFLQIDTELNHILQKREKINLRLNEIEIEITNLKHVDLNNLSGNSLFKELDDIFSKIKELTNKKELVKSTLNSFYYNNPFDISSLDLEEINRRYSQNNKKIEEINLNINELNYLVQKIKDKNFDVGCFANFLNDFVSTDIIKNIQDLSIKIHDDKNHLQKEIDRFYNSINIQKVFLEEHLQELIKVKNIELKNLLEQANFLNHKKYHLINKEIDNLNIEAKNLVKTKINNLNNEKKLLISKIENIKQELDKYPEKMLLEKDLNHKSDITKKMIEELTRVIEAKTLDYHLSDVESKIIDRAVIPKQANSNHLIMYAFIAFIIGGFVSFVYFLYQAILRGFPISFDSLKAANYKICGTISFAVESLNKITKKDLETIKRISFFIGMEKQIVTLIGSDGPNYSHLISALISVNKKVLLIEVNDHSLDESNLIRFLARKIKKMPIKKLDNYDYMSIKEIDKYSFELVSSNAFYKVLEKLKEKYDIIFIYGNFKVEDTQSLVFLNCSNKIVLSFREETFENIRILDEKINKDNISFVKY